MSVNIQLVEVNSGDDDYVERAWQLKEQIRTEEGVLRQRRHFFTTAYERATTYLYIDRSDDTLIGFATVRRDGYILFLAVDPEYRGQGFGRRLVARVADKHSAVTCHARTTNEEAIEFYRSLGFETQRRVEGYYEDSGDAYFLQLGDEPTIRERLAERLRMQD